MPERSAGMQTARSEQVEQRVGRHPGLPLPDTGCTGMGGADVADAIGEGASKADSAYMIVSSSDARCTRVIGKFYARFRSRRLDLPVSSIGIAISKINRRRWKLVYARRKICRAIPTYVRRYAARCYGRNLAGVWTSATRLRPDRRSICGAGRSEPARLREASAFFPEYGPCGCSRSCCSRTRHGRFR